MEYLLHYDSPLHVFTLTDKIRGATLSSTIEDNLFSMSASATYRGIQFVTIDILVLSRPGKRSVLDYSTALSIEYGAMHSFIPKCTRENISDG